MIMGIDPGVTDEEIKEEIKKEWEGKGIDIGWINLNTRRDAKTARVRLSNREAWEAINRGHINIGWTGDRKSVV